MNSSSSHQVLRSYPSFLQLKCDCQNCCRCKKKVKVHRSLWCDLCWRMCQLPFINLEHLKVAQTIWRQIIKQMERLWKKVVMDYYKVLSQHVWRKWEKITKTSFRISGLMATIWKQNLPNMLRSWPWRYGLQINRIPILVNVILNKTFKLPTFVGW